MMSVERRPKNSYFDLLTVDGCKRVLSAYDLGEVLAIDSLIVKEGIIVNLLERSETSRKTVVRTTTGLYFLKQIPWYCAKPDLIEFSAQFANACARENLPVPAIRKTRGGTLCTEYDGGYFTVSDLAVGMLYEGESQQVTASGDALAHLHLVGDSLDSTVEGPVTTTQGIVEDHIVLAKRIAGERSESQAVFDALFTMLDAFNCPSHLKQYHVHGDYIPWNIAFKSDGSVAAIYDFDNASLDSRLHDVGEALVAWASLNYLGRHAGLAPEIQCVIDESISASFLQAYERVAPLTPEERHALPLHVLGAWWEALLLGYIKGEISLFELDKLTELPAVVDDWSKNVL